jgi:hypothetical protein
MRFNDNAEADDALQPLQRLPPLNLQLLHPPRIPTSSPPMEPEPRSRSTTS